MSHIEPDDLATLALDGVRPEGETRLHLEDCDACRAAAFTADRPYEIEAAVTA